jgi:hypothetical protein
MDRTKRGAARTVTIAVAAGVLLGFWSVGCEDPLAPFNEITATSGSPQGGTVAPHSHQATIPARFVNEPPLDNVTITTTSAGLTAHTHDVELSPAQLMDLQQNMAIVNVASSGPSAGTNHYHSFLFER